MKRVGRNTHPLLALFPKQVLPFPEPDVAGRNFLLITERVSQQSILIQDGATVSTNFLKTQASVLMRTDWISFGALAVALEIAASTLALKF